MYPCARNPLFFRTFIKAASRPVAAFYFSQWFFIRFKIESAVWRVLVPSTGVLQTDMKTNTHFWPFAVPKLLFSDKDRPCASIIFLEIYLEERGRALSLSLGLVWFGLVYIWLRYLLRYLLRFVLRFLLRYLLRLLLRFCIMFFLLKMLIDFSCLNWIGFQVKLISKAHVERISAQFWLSSIKVGLVALSRINLIKYNLYY